MSIVNSIAVRLEGGIGDVLLGNRFVSAIKEKYPSASVHAWLDTEGNPLQKTVLELAYPKQYDSITTIAHKKEKPFMVKTQFGEDNYYGALENCPDEFREQMAQKDLFYDLHIDSLKWMNMDFDWLRYFQFFPRPVSLPAGARPKYIVCHLASEFSSGHRMDKWYMENLLTRLAQIAPVYVISTPKTNDLFPHSVPNVHIVNASLDELLPLIEHAALMVSTDSGLRYLAYGYSVPVITFSAQCTAPQQVLESHRVRWLLFPRLCYPLNYNAAAIATAALKIFNEPGYALAPYINDLDNQLVRRKWTKI